MKLVISACYGGFGLSEAAVRRYCEITGTPIWVIPATRFAAIMGPTYSLVPPDERVPSAEDRWAEMELSERKGHNEKWSAQTLYPRDIKRDDPALVQVVEEMGEAANDRFSSLKVVEIPDDVEWEIDEYDGYEHVAEKHRTWS